MSGRLVAILRALLPVVLLSAADLQAATAGREQYIVVLRQANASGPDVAAAGGAVVSRTKDTLIVSLPPAAAAAIAAHSSVHYMQRVVVGVTREHVAAGDAASDVRASGSPKEMTPEATPPTWHSGDYEYDDAGNIIHIGTPAAPDADGRNSSFVYDGVGRLSRMTIAHGTAVEKQESYAYDGFGNLTQITTNGLVHAIPANAATNRLSAELYDAAGNQTRNGVYNFVHDPFNMLRERTGPSISDTQFYVYTAADERIGVKYDEGDNAWYWAIRDLDGNVLREFRAYLNPVTYNDVAWTWVEDHVWHGRRLLGGERVANLGGRRHFHLDHLGSIRMMTNASGGAMTINDYYPYGREMTASDQEVANGYDRDEPMRFTGHERDHAPSAWAELDYMHARYYSALNGRFLSPDPVLGNLLLPGSWNRYAYVLGSPINLIDAYGLQEAEPAINCQYTRCEGSITVFAEEIDLPLPVYWLMMRPRSPYQYASRDDAARAAIQNICSESVRIDREFGGMIYEKNGRFGFSAPIQGTPHDVSNAFGSSTSVFDAAARLHMLPPPGVRMVATYHTHGADSTRTMAGRNFKYRDEAFSNHDIRSSVKLQLPAYLGTPSGRVLLWDTRMRDPNKVTFDTQIGTVPCR